MRKTDRFVAAVLVAGVVGPWRGRRLPAAATSSFCSAAAPGWPVEVPVLDPDLHEPGLPRSRGGAGVPARGDSQGGRAQGPGRPRATPRSRRRSRRASTTSCWPTSPTCRQLRKEARRVGVEARRPSAPVQAHRREELAAAEKGSELPGPRRRTRAAISWSSSTRPCRAGAKGVAAICETARLTVAAHARSGSDPLAVVLAGVRRAVSRPRRPPARRRGCRRRGRRGCRSATGTSSSTHYLGTATTRPRLRRPATRHIRTDFAGLQLGYGVTDRLALSCRSAVHHHESTTARSGRMRLRTHCADSHRRRPLPRHVSGLRDSGFATRS